MHTNIITATRKTLENSSLLVIISMCLLYTVCFLFFANFYQNYLLTDFFSNSFFRFLISFCAALAIQLLRFSFAVMGSFDLSSGNKNGAFWGLGLSASITIFEVIEAVFACNQIGLNNSGSLMLFIVPIVLFSYMAEIRLILTFSGEVSQEIEKAEIIQEIESGGTNEKVQLVKRTNKILENRLSRKPKLREIYEEINRAVSVTTIAKYLKQ